MVPQSVKELVKALECIEKVYSTEKVVDRPKKSAKEELQWEEPTKPLVDSRDLIKEEEAMYNYQQ